jgi:hypothetical protein
LLKSHHESKKLLQIEERVREALANKELLDTYGFHSHVIGMSLRVRLLDEIVRLLQMKNKREDTRERLLKLI